jgi:hypothetical protein
VVRLVVQRGSDGSIEASMTEIIQPAHVTCVKESPWAAWRAVAKYRRHIAELGGFEKARCASDAD